MDRHDRADERAPLLPDRPASTPAGDRTEDGIVHWRSELALLLKYSLPLIATYLLQYSFLFVPLFSFLETPVFRVLEVSQNASLVGSVANM